MANKPNLSPIAKVNNSSSNMISPTTSINLDETSPNKSNLDSSLNNLSGLSQSSTVQDYSLMLLKKSREVERLNDGLILQEALRPADTDDLFELFAESLKVGRAVRIIGNDTIHKLQLLLKELTTLETIAKNDNTTKNVTAELEALNALQRQDRKHRAAVLIQTFFRAKKVYYDERVNRIARFWRLYSCTMKLRLSAMCVMRCPMCKKPTPIELEVANGNSAWAPKLKKSFSCTKCKSYILARPVITQLPFTNPRIPKTYEIEVKKILRSLGYIDLQVNDYASALKPTWGKQWDNEDYEQLLESPNNFANGMKKCLGIKLSRSAIRTISQLPIYNGGYNGNNEEKQRRLDDILDISFSKPRSPRRNSILVSSPTHLEMEKEEIFDEVKTDVKHKFKSSPPPIKNKKSSYHITIISAAGLKRETTSYILVDVDNQIEHQSIFCNKKTTSPEYNDDFIVHVHDNQKIQMRVMRNNGDCLGVADLDIVKHLKYFNIGEKPEMISLRLHNKVFGAKVNKKEEKEETSANGILIIMNMHYKIIVVFW